MKTKLIIIKLGGSVVTKKDSKIPQVRNSVITRIAHEIKQLSQEKYQFILVHGAGSFGHPIVKKYNLHLGMKTDEQKLAFSQTQQNMLKLNSIIMKHLLEANISATSFPPHNFVVQSAGKLNYLELGMIKKYLVNNQIPILFGDMVLDDKWGCSVLSGDTIVSYLAKKLKADQVIFLSDVDGISDSDPKKNPQAKLIPQITNKNLKQVLKGLTPTERVDVTGEMQGKILAIKRDLSKIPVYVINGLKDDTLSKAVRQNDIGTRLLLG